MEYTFCKPESADDYEDLYKLMDSAFGDEDVRGITRRFAENHPEMSNEDFFMVKKGNEVAAGLILLPQKWVIDGVEVKVAEMGCVGTRPEHRRKRLQWILNDQFDSYARENGFDLCVLAGIPYFYRQFGYQYAVDLDIATQIECKKIPKNDSNLMRRKPLEADISQMDKILRKTQEEYFVKSIRTPEIWRMQEETGTYGGDVFKSTVLGREGELVGYYRYVIDDKNSTLYVRELGYIGASVEEVASSFRRHAEEKGLAKIKTAVAHIDPISVYLRKLGATVNRAYAWQIKPLDLFGLMDKMRPAFEKRIVESQFKGLTKVLRFNFFKFAVKMEIENGAIKNMEKYYNEEKRTLGFNPYAFIQLITGYRSWKELTKAYPDFWVRENLGDLIDVMFPTGPGYIHYAY